MTGATECNPATETRRMFDGFAHETIKTSGADINLVHGGSGPPVLLLHGSPQTHVAWHGLAPMLTESHTVVAADLRGYGDSSKPLGGGDHSMHSFRAMAADQLEAMRALGHELFAVVGHDRGARVAHRMARDHPRAVERVAFLDIVPTEYVYAHVDRSAAAAPEALAEYERCFADPAAIRGMCEDYRAAGSIDLAPDAETAALLAMLAAGMTDASIARSLSWSMRTTQRRMRQLMNDLGATSRFQAGVAAREKRWL